MPVEWILGSIKLVVDSKILKTLTRTEVSKMQNVNKIAIDWGSRGKLV